MTDRHPREAAEVTMPQGPQGPRASLLLAAFLVLSAAAPSQASTVDLPVMQSGAAMSHRRSLLVPPSPYFWRSAFGYNATAGSGTDYFRNPRGMAGMADGTFYVADSNNHRIKYMAPNGTVLLVWGTLGDGVGQLNRPFDVAVDLTASLLFVAENVGNRVSVFSMEGLFASIWGEGGTDDGQLNYPQGICADGNGGVYVTDLYRVQKFDRDGNWQWTAGSGTVTGSGDGEFSTPVGCVCVDDKVYVADRNNHRIQALHQSNGTFDSKFGSLGSALGEFNSPQYVALGTDNQTLLVSEAANYRVQWVSLAGVGITTIGSNGRGDGQFKAPTGVTTYTDYGLDNFAAIAATSQPVATAAFTTPSLALASATEPLATPTITPSALPLASTTEPLPASAQPLAASSQPLATPSITPSAFPLAATTEPIPASTQPLAPSALPLSSTTEPLPSSTQPLAAPSQPLATTSLPIPTTSKPIAATSLSLPPSTKPFATSTKPPAAVSKPTPSIAIPSPALPLAATTEPLPASTQPLAASSQPLSTTSVPIPATSQPIATTSVSLSPSAKPFATSAKPLAAASKPLPSIAIPSTAFPLPATPFTLPTSPKPLAASSQSLSAGAQPPAATPPSHVVTFTVDIPGETFSSFGQQEQQRLIDAVSNSSGGAEGTTIGNITQYSARRRSLLAAPDTEQDSSDIAFGRASQHLQPSDEAATEAAGMRSLLAGGVRVQVTSTFRGAGTLPAASRMANRLALGFYNWLKPAFPSASVRFKTVRLDGRLIVFYPPPVPK
ncbi:hypothetical protein ABPG77_003555 [Micractinium sp. CCAP 211/92]